MNQSFFVTLTRRGFWGGLECLELGLGGLEGRDGGSWREEDVAVRDLYHSAVEVESWSGFSGAVVGENVCDGNPHSS